MSDLSLKDIMFGDFIEKAKADYDLCNPANGTGMGETLLCLVASTLRQGHEVRVAADGSLLLKVRCPVCTRKHDLRIPHHVARRLGDTRYLVQNMKAMGRSELIELSTGTCRECQRILTAQKFQVDHGLPCEPVTVKI